MTIVEVKCIRIIIIDLLTKFGRMSSMTAFITETNRKLVINHKSIILVRCLSSLAFHKVRYAVFRTQLHFVLEVFIFLFFFFTNVELAEIEFKIVIEIFAANDALGHFIQATICIMAHSKYTYEKQTKDQPRDQL